MNTEYVLSCSFREELNVKGFTIETEYMNHQNSHAYTITYKKKKP